MTSRVSRFLGLLRAVAMIAVVAGAGGSIGLMLRVGRRNDSRILLALFGIWVLSPFLALVFANVVSMRWPGEIMLKDSSDQCVGSMRAPLVRSYQGG